MLRFVVCGLVLVGGMVEKASSNKPERPNIIFFLTDDQGWIEPSQADVKVLTLEHHMAANRGGFSTFFDPLYEVSKLKTGLLDGTLPGVSLFSTLPPGNSHLLAKRPDFLLAITILPSFSKIAAVTLIMLFIVFLF